MAAVLFALPEKTVKTTLPPNCNANACSPDDLPPLSITILKLLREHERLTIAELERLTEANRNTLKVRLRELTQATWYSFR